MKQRVLVFCDFYLPGFGAGGGMRTVVNLVDRFKHRFDFFVVTRNYDCRANTTPYTSVNTGEWNSVGGALVYYLADGDITATKLAEVTNEVRPDLVYLNSVFATAVVKFLLARAKGLTPPVSVILAPCGELSRRALSIKPLKKRAYLAYAKARRLFDGVIWKASNETETAEVLEVFGNNVEVMAAPDLAPTMILPEYHASVKPAKEVGNVRFVSLSRVVPIKNLRYFLELLNDVEGRNISLDIVGPVEDEKYWTDCQNLIDRFPDSIRVTVSGPVSYEVGLKHLLQAHFFVLPTLSENFGYVFIESLAAGTPLLISDRTMWGSVQKQGCGWALPLDDRSAWKTAIDRCIQMDGDEFLKISDSARRFAVDWLSSSGLENAVAEVLDRALAVEAAVS